MASALLLSLSSAAKAQLTLQLDQSAVTVQPGGSFDITAQLIADPSNTETVAGYSLQFTPVPPTTSTLGFIPLGAPPDPTVLTVDDTGFFANFDGASSSVAAGTELLHFDVGSMAPAGEYTGSISFDDAGANTLTTASFDLNIASVPEMGSLPLMGGLLAMGGLTLRRRSRA
jgi:hypothetical protein